MTPAGSWPAYQNPVAKPLPARSSPATKFKRALQLEVSYPNQALPLYQMAARKPKVGLMGLSLIFFLMLVLSSLAVIFVPLLILAFFFLPFYFFTSYLDGLARELAQLGAARCCLRLGRDELAYDYLAKVYEHRKNYLRPLYNATVTLASKSYTSTPNYLQMARRCRFYGKEAAYYYTSVDLTEALWARRAPEHLQTSLNQARHQLLQNTPAESGANTSSSKAKVDLTDWSTIKREPPAKSTKLEKLAWGLAMERSEPYRALELYRQAQRKPLFTWKRLTLVGLSLLLLVTIETVCAPLLALVLLLLLIYNPDPHLSRLDRELARLGAARCYLRLGQPGHATFCLRQVYSARVPTTRLLYNATVYLAGGYREQAGAYVEWARKVKVGRYETSHYQASLELTQALGVNQKQSLMPLASPATVSVKSAEPEHPQPSAEVAVEPGDYEELPTPLATTALSAKPIEMEGAHETFTISVEPEGREVPQALEVEALIAEPEEVLTIEDKATAEEMIPSASLAERSPQPKAKKGPQAGPLAIRAGVDHRQAKLVYRIELENQGDYHLAQVRVRLDREGLDLKLSATKESVELLYPGQKRTLFFSLKPRLEGANNQLEARVSYLDPVEGREVVHRLEPLASGIVWPRLRPREVELAQWRKMVNGLEVKKERLEGLPLPPQLLFELVGRVVEDLNLYRLPPLVTQAPSYYNGLVRFTGREKEGGAYGVQVEVVSGPSSTRLLLQVWAPSQAALVGFHYLVTEALRDRLEVGEAAEPVVYQVNGDYVGGSKTEVRDSVVSRWANEVVG